MIALLYSTLNQSKISYHLIRFLNKVLLSLKLNRLVAYPIKGHAFHGLLVKQPNYAYNEYEPDVVNCINKLIQKGWICVDIGAHVGIFTLLLAKLSGPGGKIISVEAHPDNARKMKENIELNKLGHNVTIINRAIIERPDEEITLYHGRGEASEEWNIMGHDLKGAMSTEHIRVRTTAIDKFLKNESRVDFIKIDIEGAEGLALYGAKHIMETMRPTFLIEFHNDECWEQRKLLVKRGYVLYDMNDQSIGTDSPRVHHCLARCEHP